MTATIELAKVIVITEAHYEQEMLTSFQKLGIKGFTCMNCWGQGHHQVYDEPFMDHSQTRIEMITTDEIADSIVDFCRQPRFETHAITVYLESVRVRDPDKFIT
ncbi:P-II family nitrogen regulator [Gimesia maris]|uniref:Nitrogen regulatory protein P-II n=1 Tax=Gimesia maris TaxID=122 RepID=A0ABX5YJD5_9PLAN|nr:hypothetical protein [Gimesia maris]HAW31459.1 hypothetical protein [Planctomycetaceae bacterium]EDL58019.1 hypothetical protein PM8797T_15516 [Gimesia maris DSM 8797]QDU13839.1 hypothetical protein CA11_16250 [Gimesia maris]QEG15806.1 hypothetical protein GmarT_16490 [Gimesia maris]QGQ30920.1 hypothetical protein F1729_21060 [Gimesia maris]|tara:strand:+ start:211 stop:522 length:312 start_codon:yes stop_codon:yes gene_type:complete